MPNTLGGTAILNARVQIPAWGVWWADVELAEAVALEGQQILLLGDQTLVGTIASGGENYGRSRFRLAGGRAAWGTVLPALAYDNDAGVKKSTVLGDAANACGEVVVGASIDRVGPHYVRPEGPASSALNLLEPKNWYVDFEGLTQIGQRSTSLYSGDAAITRAEPSKGLVELAVDSLTGLVPGVTVQTESGLSAPAIDVEWNLSGNRFSVCLWTSEAGRRSTAWQDLIGALLPDLQYRGTYEYRVVSPDGDRLNLQPVRAVLGLPLLRRVPVRGMPGLKATVFPGSLVLVSFVDADPGRPVVVGFDAPDNPGWMPQTVELNSLATSVKGTTVALGNAPGLGVARMTDTVQAGPFAGTITLGSTSVTAGV